ncbi:hypothetical protein LTS16_026971, partial [Friedmanniomyces endolithicus]
LSIMSAESRESPRNDTAACQDGEADRNTADTDTNWVVAIDVESLSRPEHQNRKEVRSGDEGDDEGRAKDARILSQPLREHGMLPNLASHKKKPTSKTTPRMSGARTWAEPHGYW